MNNSKIEWTHHTQNLWWGCSKVHAGCDNCYAEALAHRFGDDVWGNDVPRKEIKSSFRELEKMQKAAEKAGEIHRVFVGSMMDIFEKPMPLIGNDNANTGNLRFHLFYRIDRGDYPNLMFLLLTKRPGNINKYIFESWKENPPKNVMFGTSPVDQSTANKLIPQLAQVRGMKFLSIEPQLGLIDLTQPIYTEQDTNVSIRLIDMVQWVIQGGESGPRKRPFNLYWARSMRDQCAAIGKPYFFKQIDKIHPIPEDLQIRQFPNL